MAHVLLSSLGVVCGACDELNDAPAAACRACGKPLQDAAAPSTARREPAPATSARVPPGPASRPASPAPSSLAASFPEASSSPATASTARAAAAPLPTSHTPSTPVVRTVPLPAASPLPAPPNLGRTPAPVLGPRSPLPPTPSPGASVPSAAAMSSPARPVAGSRFIVGVVGGPARGQRFRLMATGCSVGRSKGAILFPDDTFVSPQHAAFRVREGNLFLKDESSASGVYVSISKPEPLEPGRQFCIGQRLFRYLGPLSLPAPERGKPMPYGSPIPPGSTLHRLEEVLVGGRPGRAVVTAGPLYTLGQGPCDLAFPSDAGLATRHCELSFTSTGASLRDLSGGLGTFLRMGAEERVLHPGDRVRIGQQTLQIEVSV